MRAPQPAVIENEAERLDQVDPKPQTGAKPNHGAGISIKHHAPNAIVGCDLSRLAFPI